MKQTGKGLRLEFTWNFPPQVCMFVYEPHAFHQEQSLLGIAEKRLQNLEHFKSISFDIEFGTLFSGLSIVLRLRLSFPSS